MTGALHSRRRLRLALLVAPATLWLVIFAIVPLGLLLVMSFWRTTIFGFSKELTLDNYRTAFSSWVYVSVLLDAIKVAAITTILTLVTTYPVAYAATRLRGRARSLFLLALFVPFWTSYVVRTFVWLPMLGRSGFINSLLMGLGIVGEPLDGLLYSQATVLIGLVYVYSLFMILPIYMSLDRIDPALLEAASDLGARPARQFFRVTLPLSKPGMVSGCIMVFLLAAGAFVTPQLLGGTSGIMFGNVIASQYLTTSDWAFGAALSIILIVTIFLCMALLGRGVRFEQVFVAGGH